jgi:DHA1 family bicyclomycin/chloramphenicol resistance-like MFS transporter
VGRRIPILAGCLLFSCTALVCATTQNIHTLLAARFLMGFGGSAGIVVSRAIVRDLFEEAEAARFYTLMMVAISISPIVAPLLGSMFLTYFNWRAIFWFLMVFGVVCLAGVLRYCPETLAKEKRMRGHIGDVFRGYGRVLTNRRFFGPAVALGSTSGILFTYLSSSSYVFIELFGIPVALFGILFAMNAIGFSIASQTNRWLLRRFTSGQLLRSALWVNVGAALLMIACTVTRVGGFPLFFAFLFLCISTLGVILPNAAAITMQPFPDEAGSASALLGIVQYILGATAGALVGVFQSKTALPVPVQILCFGLTAQGMLLLCRTAPAGR